MELLATSICLHLKIMHSSMPRAIKPSIIVTPRKKVRPLRFLISFVFSVLTDVMCRQESKSMKGLRIFYSTQVLGESHTGCALNAL